jgi:predicted phosphodiesterase
MLPLLEAARNGWEPEDYSTRLYIPEQRIAVASDVHVPYQDDDLLERFFRVCRTLKVEAIVWLGDLMDMPLFSPWGTDDNSTTLERELDQVSAILHTTDKYGIRSYWSAGNHEERLARRLCHETSMERLALLAGAGDLLESGALWTSDNPTLEYGDDWLLTHPATYSANPLSTPGYLADLEQKNLVAGHAHHWGMGRSPSGKFTVVESGGLFEPKFFKYIQHRPSKHRAWCKGFVILDHGTPHLVDGSGTCPTL